MPFIKMRTEIHTPRPLAGSGVRLATLPCRMSIDRTHPAKRIAPPLVACSTGVRLRSSWLEPSKRDSRRLRASVPDTDVDVAEPASRNSSGREDEMEPFAKFIRQSYLVGAFSVSVAVKVWEACGKLADTTAEVAQDELPTGVRRHGMTDKIESTSAADAASTAVAPQATLKPVVSPTVSRPPKPAKARSEYKSTLPDMVAPVKTGTKEWVGMWWPTAMVESQENEKAMLDAAENVNATIAELAKLFGSNVATTAAEMEKAVGDARVGLREALTPKKATQEPVVTQEKTKRERFGFMRSLPIVRSFMGRKDSKETPKPEEKANVDTPKGTFQLPVIKTAQKLVADKKASDPPRTEERKDVDAPKAPFQLPVMKALQKLGANDKTTDEVGTTLEEQDSSKDQKPGAWAGISSSIPILQSFSGKSTDQEKSKGVSEETKKETASAPGNVISQTVAKTVAAKDMAASALTTAKESITEKTTDVKTKAASALKTAREAASQAAEKTVEAKEKAASTLSKAKHAASQAASQAADKTAEAKKTAPSALSKEKETASQAADKAAEAKDKAASVLSKAKEAASQAADKTTEAEEKAASALSKAKEAASQATDKTAEAKDKAASVLPKVQGAVAQSPAMTKEAKEKASSTLTTPKEAVVQTAANLTEVARKETQSALQRIMQRTPKKEDPVESKTTVEATQARSNADGQQEPKEVKSRGVGRVGPSGSPSEGSGLLDRLSEMTVTASDKASGSVATATSGNGSSGNGKMTEAAKAKATEPVGLGKGLGSGPSKVTGGALGGSFTPKEREMSKGTKALERTAGAVTLGGMGGGAGKGGHGSGGSSGGGGRGDSEGKGGSGEGSERGFPFGILVLMSIATAVVAGTVVWRTKSRQQKTIAGVQGVDVKTAEA